MRGRWRWITVIREKYCYEIVHISSNGKALKIRQVVDYGLATRYKHHLRSRH